MTANTFTIHYWDHGIWCYADELESALRSASDDYYTMQLPDTLDEAAIQVAVDARLCVLHALHTKPLHDVLDPSNYDDNKEAL